MTLLVLFSTTFSAIPVVNVRRSSAVAEKLAAGPYHNDNVDIGKSNKRRPMITVKATVKLCLDTFSDFTFFIFRLTLNDFEGAFNSQHCRGR